MILVERYIFRTGLIAFLTALFSLTAVIWLTQALKQFDLLTTKGQTLLIFLALTGLTIPLLVVVIAPIALFIAVLYTLNKLNSDSELIVASAAGVSPARILVPFAVLGLLAAALVTWVSLWAMPDSFRASRDLVSSIRADILTRVVREGQFTTLDDGFVFHYREKGADGSLLGIFMQDRRNPSQVNTYIAEKGATTQRNGQNLLVLESGSYQKQSNDSRDPAIVVFDSYAVDLSQFIKDTDAQPLRPRERTTLDLLRSDPNDTYVQANKGLFRAELHDRLVNPLFALMMGAIAFAALAQPRTTRQGRGLAVGGAIIAVAIARLAGFGASVLVARSSWALVLAYGIPLAGLVGSWWFVFGPRLPAAALLFAGRPPLRLRGQGAA